MKKLLLIFCFSIIASQYIIAQPGITFSEIMFAPESGPNEFVEIYNLNDIAIDLTGYQIKYYTAGNDQIISTGSGLLLNPHSFAVIFENDYDLINGIYKNIVPAGALVLKISDNSFGSTGMANSSDRTLVLLNNSDDTVDTYTYSANNSNGYSDEKIHLTKDNSTANWTNSTSLNGTPGKENSFSGLIPYKPHSIIVNEIMSNPNLHGSEFIELYNISNDIINLDGWTINDKSGSVIPVSKGNQNLENNCYFLLAEDSSIIKDYNINVFKNVHILNSSSMSLSAFNDVVLLKDALGNTIDSVNYFESWHNPNFIITKGKSLEKISPYLSGNDPKNWSTCTNPVGATPGKQNSIYTISTNIASKVSVSPNPFSPDNDGYEDFTIIHYKLTQKIAQVRVKIFDSRGRLVRTLENNLASGNEGSIIFNGLGDNKQPLRIGIYIALIEAISQNKGSTDKMRAAIVIGKKF
jgi:Lamin Tail Domain/CHU_C Type IX secretion signal domain